MARITVEDCLDNVDNRFELVMVASKRARQIATGGKLPMVEEDGDKPTVIALREIEKGLITDEVLREAELETPEYQELDLAADFGNNPIDAAADSAIGGELGIGLGNADNSAPDPVL